jgi:Holliday junction DNA helicase RuvA
MIGYISGEITFLDLTRVIVETGGIGYELRISLNTYMHLKDLKKVKLFAHLQIREDAHLLYGFYDSSEKALFTQLIGVSGIGPSTAIVVLSSMELPELEEAIASGDLLTIKSIKGIGQKTAERIIMELKDKVRKEKGIDLAQESGGQSQSVRKEALSALVTLGIQRSTAEKMLLAIIQKHGKDISVEEMIKLALKTA